MDTVVKAIRNALEKGDAYDRAFRERVYRSAFAALERSLAARPDLAPEEMRQRRENLKAKIVDIESEFVPAVDPEASDPAMAHAPSEPPPVAPETRDEAAADPGEPAPVEGERVSDPPAAPADGIGTADTPRIDRENTRDVSGEAPALGGAGERGWRDEGRGRSRLALTFLLGTFVVGAIIGGWWLLQSGILMPAAEHEGEASNPPLEAARDFESESGGDGGDSPETPAPARRTVTVEKDWLTVFEPSDPTRVGASGGAEAEVVEEDERSFMRISSAEGEAVAFDVGQGVLEELAGERAVFAVRARASEGEETEIAISCDFGDFADCGRTRYVVGISESEYLFEVELPGGRPGSGGRLLVVPDVSGEGRALEVFSIHAAAAD